MLTNQNSKIQEISPSQAATQETILRLKAGYPIIWVQSDEHARSAASIIRAIQAENERISEKIQEIQEKGEEIPEGLAPSHIFTWDVINGLVDSKGSILMPVTTGAQATPAYKHILSWAGQINEVKLPENCVVLVNGFHNLLDMTNDIGRVRAAFLQVVRPVTAKLSTAKGTQEIRGLREEGLYRSIILIGPKKESPILSSDLLGYIETIDFPRPSPEEITETIHIQMEGRTDKAGKEILANEEVVTQSVKELRGTTIFQIENALALTYVKNKSLDPRELRAQYKKLMELHPAVKLASFSENWENLIGFEVYKKFVKALFTETARQKTPKGVFFLGVPGGGKSHAAKATGNFLGWKTLTVNIGKVFHKHIGETESNMDSLLKSINACGESIVFIDEIEKAFGGMGSGGDSGVSNRVLEQFLIWMNDHPKGPFLIGTANDVADKLPQEFLREGRWDCIFFVPPPTETQRVGIFELYAAISELNIDHKAHAQRTENWTGAEIKGLTEKAEILRRILPNDETAMDHAYDLVSPLCESDPQAFAQRIEDGERRGINVNGKEAKKLLEEKPSKGNETISRRRSLL